MYLGPVTDDIDNFTKLVKTTPSSANHVIEGYEYHAKGISCDFPTKHSSRDVAISFCNRLGPSCQGIHKEFCDERSISTCFETRPVPNSTRTGCTYVKKGTNVNYKLT